MKPIDRILITCCQRDFWLTRICVASIRYWYPDIPIGLIKDTSLGDFSTVELEEVWKVSSVLAPDPPRGCYTKLEAFHLPGRERILMLDSDIVFLGRVLELLEARDEDFVVNWGGTRPLSDEEKRRYASNGYYDMDRLREFLPGFVVPDYFFNAGQMLITTSLVPRERVEGWLKGTPPRQAVRHSEFVFCEDQGILNIVLGGMAQEGRCSLGICDFVRWSIHPEMVRSIDLGEIRERRGIPALLHWAERKSFFKSGLIRGDILGFFEDYYYSRITQGEWKRNCRLFRRARKQVPSRTLKLIALSGKKIDLLKLARAERRRAPEADTEAFIR